MATKSNTNSKMTTSKTTLKAPPKSRDKTELNEVRIVVPRKTTRSQVSTTSTAKTSDKKVVEGTGSSKTTTAEAKNKASYTRKYNELVEKDKSIQSRFKNIVNARNQLKVQEVRIVLQHSQLDLEEAELIIEQSAFYDEVNKFNLNNASKLHPETSSTSLH